MNGQNQNLNDVPEYNSENVNMQNVEQPVQEERVEQVLTSTKEGLKADTLKSKKVKYKYRVENQKGKKFYGYLDAYNQAEVISYLENEGYKIIKIEAQNSVLNMQIGSGKLFRIIIFTYSVIYIFKSRNSFDRFSKNFRKTIC